jgi:hypothetical protein
MMRRRERLARYLVSGRSVGLAGDSGGQHVAVLRIVGHGGDEALVSRHLGVLEVLLHERDHTVDLLPCRGIASPFEVAGDLVEDLRTPPGLVDAGLREAQQQVPEVRRIEHVRVQQSYEGHGGPGALLVVEAELAGEAADLIQGLEPLPIASLLVDEQKAESLLLEQTEFDYIRRFFSLRSMDLSAPSYEERQDDTTSLGRYPQRRQYKAVGIDSVEHFRGLSSKAEAYLTGAGVDLGKVPLLQVLDSHEILSITDAYKRSYGDITWDESDYLIVMLAGLVATLLDTFLVRIPADARFLGRLQPGSPLTKWLKDNSKPVHNHVLNRFEYAARVPYDDPTSKLIARA